MPESISTVSAISQAECVCMALCPGYQPNTGGNTQVIGGGQFVFCSEKVKEWMSIWYVDLDVSKRFVSPATNTMLTNLSDLDLDIQRTDGWYIILWSCSTFIRHWGWLTKHYHLYLQVLFGKERGRKVILVKTSEQNYCRNRILCYLLTSQSKTC